MGDKKTAQALSVITDAGFFECLATEILREADQNYRLLVHTGVNASGKTVKSPVDGICYLPGANPPHMIAIHHTTTPRNNLKKKWLHDPSKVKSHKNTRSKMPEGDLIKTAELAAEERIRTPNLRVTLVLTTNQEPDEALVRDVEAEGRNRGLEIKIWSCSTLSYFLDRPSGQWIRSKFLGIVQEQLSAELLHELSKKSLNIHTDSLFDNPIAWIPRTLDTTLATSLRHDITFLVAESGLGKSVACNRLLTVHIENGGFGIVLPPEAVASAMTLEQAITTTLCQLHPPLAVEGPSALSFCSPERPLLLIVDDINRSGQARISVEKLAGWSHTSTGTNKNLSPSWGLICPLWPDIYASLGDQAQKCIERLVISTGGFNEIEGREAVLARARLDGLRLSSLSAETISRALGHDPLLIALHDHNKAPDPYQTISQFIERSLSRIAAEEKAHPADDYRNALRALAGEILSKRPIELIWSEVSHWTGLQGESLHLISRLAHNCELIQFTGQSNGQQLSFRHDRVRDWLLADAAAELDSQDSLSEEVVADPHFAEVMGAVLVWRRPNSIFLKRVAALNPLALFYTLRLIDQANESHRNAIIQTINDRLDDPVMHNPSNLHLRWEVLAMLAETDFTEVPKLVQKISDRTISGKLARLRNGDLSGGIELCFHIAPGKGAPWRDKQIEHAKFRYGDKYTKELNILLCRTDLDSSTKIGALRLAGHFANSALALSIEACWVTDNERVSHIDDYLWAFGKCCGNNPAHFLEPVCDTWATLPDKAEKDGWPSPREELVEFGLNWAFQKWPPVAAIDYFIQRGLQDDLKWPILLMLRNIDHPKAILFVVRELAAKQHAFMFGSFANMGWEDAQKKGCPMSKASRDLLLGLWQDDKNEISLRSQAFSFWSATKDANDMLVLQESQGNKDLADRILRHRLVLGDHSAIPLLLEKLTADDSGYWWHCGRYLWSSKLTDALDRFLERRGTQAKCIWGESFNSDWIIHELIMQLPESEAERLLLKHWTHLHFSPHFVQTALYVSTPYLIQIAYAAINECPEPSILMEHLSSRFGIMTEGSKGLTREAQLNALAPYLHLLSPIDLWFLWEACNYLGWFALRQKLLDNLLKSPDKERIWDGNRAMLEFDKIVADHKQFIIDHLIDRFMKTGISWSEILTTLKLWLSERKSFEALQLVGAAIESRGTREDLTALTIFEGMPQIKAEELIADIKFAVCRRSIH